VLALVSGATLAAECPGNPNALGTSRVLTVDPAEHIRLGTMQYRETLPLAAKEVVLTFDDGPLPPYSNRALEILAAECVRATYFLVGRMARAYPDMVRRIHDAGHTIGTHSQNHPLTFDRMAAAKAEQEIDDGINSVKAALADPDAIAPFFRIPGLLRADGVEKSLAARSLMTWSADFPADDWRHIKANEIVRRALMRLEAKGKGILLLHDIQPATIIALPTLLKELKARGYRIVHVVAAGPDRSKTTTEPEQWTLRGPIKVASAQQGWPRLPEASVAARSTLLAAPDPANFAVGQTFSRDTLAIRSVPRGAIPLPPQSLWPRVAASAAANDEPALPVPSLQSMGAPDAAAMPQAVAFTPSAGFPSIVVGRIRTTPPHRVGSGRSRRATAQAETSAPKSIMDLLVPRPEAPPRPKARVLSSLPQTPQP
jgi:peptidoglycan/xylan/chitin deacetylase (PgdA/CDA1 family)